MTKLYLFDEDGNLCFCRDMSITSRNFRNIEEFSPSEVRGTADTLFETFLEKVRTKTANSNSNWSMAE